jgi:DNA-binding GntR family transcriptional regulator
MTEPNGPGQDPVGDPDARGGSKHLTRWVAQTLRGQIMSGELSPGDKLPSQNALEGRFNVSTVTVRNAVEELEDEGLIAKRQGAHTQVHNREPTHRLMINLLPPALAGKPAARPPGTAAAPPGAATGSPGAATGSSGAATGSSGAATGLPGATELPGEATGSPGAATRLPETATRLSGVAEPPVSFAPRERRHGRLRRESQARQVPAARHVASLLGLRDGDAVVERTLTLFYDDEPVLTSTSYLPPALAGGTAVPTVEVGQLALEGHQVTSVALRLRTRMPDPTEFENLAMVKGTPVQVLTHGVVVENGDHEEPVRAAVEVVSRGDRVYVEIKLGGR